MESWSRCLYTVFDFHNETLNIWTHIFGVVLFAILLLYTAYALSPLGVDRLLLPVSSTDTIPLSLRTLARELQHFQSSVLSMSRRLIDSAHHESEELFEFLQQVSSDPLVYLSRVGILSFQVSAISCMFVSAYYHLFHVQSPDAVIFLAKLDYAGICMLVAGTSTPAVYYGFYCSYYLRMVYMSFTLVSPLLVAILCLLDTMAQPHLRPLRSIVFMAVGVLVAAPMLHLYMVMPVPVPQFFFLFCTGGILYVSGALLYATRVPESLFPGVFDHGLHSHVIFHICVVLAAYTHYCALLDLYEWRFVFPCH